MDELELLKKDWQKEDNKYPKLSYNEIYSLLLKKSSSIVKWLFYISIAELVFWIIINVIPYFSSAEYRERLDSIYSNQLIFTGLTIFTYIVIILFIYLLYKSYKSISVTDNAKKLMESILKTRKIVKYYVIYNLAMVFISFFVVLYFAINHSPELSEQLQHFSSNQMVIFIVMIVVAFAIFLLLVWLFYRLIYGILLGRLNKNYKELKRLEV